MHNFKSSVLYPNTYKGIQYITFMTQQSATEKKDFSFKVPFEIEITEELLETMMCSAWEGGSVYWANSDFEIDVYLYSEPQPEGTIIKDGYSVNIQAEKKYLKNKMAELQIKNPYINHDDIPYSWQVPIYDFGFISFKEYDEDNTYILDQKKLIKGAKIMAQKYPRHFKNWIEETDDSITADVFLQCCLFGEIVYG